MDSGQQDDTEQNSYVTLFGIASRLFSDGAGVSIVCDIWKKLSENGCKMAVFGDGFGADLQSPVDFFFNALGCHGGRKGSSSSKSCCSKEFLATCLTIFQIVFSASSNLKFNILLRWDPYGR